MTTSKDKRAALRRGRALLVQTARTIALAACAVGCTDDRPSPAPASAEASDRWISQWKDGTRSWLRESEFDVPVQSKPKNIIYEVTKFAPATEPTGAHREAAQDLVTRCFQAALDHRWFQFKSGLDQGWQQMWSDRKHFVRPEYLFDDRELDCERPEFLMYYETEKGVALAGLMFYVGEPLGRGPQIGGPLTIWHYHMWAPLNCLRGGLMLVGEADDQGRCAEGTATHRSPEMLHVWFIERPKGPFSSSMYLAKEQIALLTEKRKPPRVLDEWPH